VSLTVLMPSLMTALMALTAPALADELPPQAVYWGALHEHTNLSRSAYSQTPASTFAYMILEADLDFGAITDYDWALAKTLWGEATRATNAFHCPEGATGCYDAMETLPGLEPLAAIGDRPFVTILGYEWNNQSAPVGDLDLQEYGHRNVYFSPREDPETEYIDGAVMSDCDGCASLVVSGTGVPEGGGGWSSYYHPCELWSALVAQPGVETLTIPHHVALSVSVWEGVDETGVQKPASTDWSVHPADCDLGLADPESIEPLVELYSVWGNGERAGMPVEEDPLDGLADDERVVREVALAGERRHRLGLIGSGDTHNGTPGHDPHHSFVREPTGEFRGHKMVCALDADCEERFGHMGLVGVVLEEGEALTRESVFDALQQRHTVATTGEKFSLRAALTANGEIAGVQGDDLRALALDEVEDASLLVSVDTEEQPIVSLSVLAAGTDRVWVEQPLDAVGLTAFSGELALAEGGEPAAWLPLGDVVMYLRVETEARGAIAVPEGVAPFTVVESGGGSGSVQLQAGRYTGAEMVAELEQAFDAAGLSATYTITYDADGEERFSIDSSEPIQLRFSESAAAAYALGFRDDGDTPEGGGRCAPCVGEVSIEGDAIAELGWASPIWFTHGEGTYVPPDTDDSATPSDTEDSGPATDSDGGGVEESTDGGEGSKSCGCGGGAGGGLWVLGVLGLLLRRRERAP